MVTICTASLTFNNSTFCPHGAFMCFMCFEFFLCKWVDQTTFLCLNSNPNAIAVAGPTCLALQTIVDHSWTDSRRERTGLQEVTQWPAESRSWDVFTVVWTVGTCLEDRWEETETSRRGCHVNPSNRCPKIAVLIAASGRQSPHTCALLVLREEDKRMANSWWSCSIDGDEVNTPTWEQWRGLCLGRENRAEQNNS